MRWLIPVFFILLCAFTPVLNQHENNAQIDDEFRNVYDEAQSREFEVVNDTPVLNDFPAGRVVLFSSGTVNKILWRVNQDIFAVSGSCITTKR